MPNWSAPWGHPTFHQERMTMIPRDTISLKELVNAWSPDKKPWLSSMSFVKPKDHMMKSTLMAPKWTREWGQRRSSTAISRMVRQPAANCPKDCQTTAPSLLLRLQPSVWHWTITNTWAQSIVMWLSTLTQCPVCRQLRVKTLRTLLFAISWTCSGHWVTRAHVFVSAGYQATVALTEMKEWIN